MEEVSRSETRFDVFLCHNSRDKDAIKELADTLSLEAGTTFFLDEYAIGAGVEYWPYIRDHMFSAQACVIFNSPHGWGKTQLREARLALEFRSDSIESKPKFRIIPINLPGSSPDNWQELFGTDSLPPFHWFTIQALPISPGSKELVQLVETVHGTSSPKLTAPDELTPHLIRRQAALWEKNESKDYLLSGKMLQAAQELVADHYAEAGNKIVHRFLRRCETVSQLRQLIILLVVISLVAAVAAVGYFGQRSRALETANDLSETEKTLAQLRANRAEEDRKREEAQALVDRASRALEENRTSDALNLALTSHDIVSTNNFVYDAPEKLLQRIVYEERKLTSFQGAPSGSGLLEFGHDPEVLYGVSANEGFGSWDLANRRFSPIPNVRSLSLGRFDSSGDAFVGSAGTKVVRIDLNKRQVQQHLNHPGKEVKYLAVSEQGDLFATLCQGVTVAVWSTSEDQPIWTWESGSDQVRGIRFLDGDRQLLVATRRIVYLFERAERTFRQVWQAQDRYWETSSIDVTEDEKYLLIGTGSIKMLMIALKTGKIERQWACTPNSAIGAVDSSLNNRRRLVLGGPTHHSVDWWDALDSRVWIWDISYPQKEPTLFGVISGHETRIPFAQFISAQQQFVLTGSPDGRIQISDSRGSLFSVLRPQSAAELTRLTASKGGKYIAAQQRDGTITVWRMAPVGSNYYSIGQSGSYGFAHDASNGVVISWSADGTISGWHAEGGKRLWRHETRVGQYTRLQLNQSEGLFSAICSTGTVETFAVRSGRRVHTKDFRKLEGGPLAPIHLSKNGDKVFLTRADDWPLVVWDRGNDRELFRCLGHSRNIRGVVQLSQNDAILSVSEDGTSRIWNRKGEEIARVSGNTQWTLARVDETRNRAVIGGANGFLYLWNLNDFTSERLNGNHSRQILIADFSPDGRLLVTGASQENTAKLWELSGQQKFVGDLPHQGTVEAADFSPNSRYLATGGSSDNVLIWDCQNLEQVGRIDAYLGDIKRIEFIAEREILVAANDGSISRWHLFPKSGAVVEFLSDRYHQAATLFPGNPDE